MTLGSLVRADDLFDSLTSEEKVEIREVEVGEGNRLKVILPSLPSLFDCKSESEAYWKIINEIQDVAAAISPTSDEINDVMRFLSYYNNNYQFTYWAGHLVETLINYCADDLIKLDIGDTINNLGHVGMRACNKSIIVNGNVGNHFGSGVNGGSLIINGNTGWYTGDGMRGGEFSVNGDTGSYCGWGMSGGTLNIAGNVLGNCAEKMVGGKIIVKGFVKNTVGTYMTGGEVYVRNGPKPRLSSCIQGGMVFYNGEQLFPRGKSV